MEKTNQGRERMLRLLDFFKYDHLKNESLKTMSKRFADLAVSLTTSGYPANEELKMALRKLLEAKDCAVRALLPVPKEDPDDNAPPDEPSEDDIPY